MLWYTFFTFTAFLTGGVLFLIPERADFWPKKVWRDCACSKEKEEKEQ